jgi:hypothetical protein
VASTAAERILWWSVPIVLWVMGELDEPVLCEYIDVLAVKKRQSKIVARGAFIGWFSDLGGGQFSMVLRLKVKIFDKIHYFVKTTGIFFASNLI